MLSFPSASLCLWSANRARFAGEAIELKPGKREMKCLNGILLETLAVLFLVTANCASFPDTASHKCPLGEGLGSGHGLWGAGNAVPGALGAVVRDVCLCGVCPFDIPLLSSSAVVLFGIRICTAEILPCLVFSSYHRLTFSQIL